MDVFDYNLDNSMHTPPPAVAYDRVDVTMIFNEGDIPTGEMDAMTVPAGLSGPANARPDRLIPFLGRAIWLAGTCVVALSAAYFVLPDEQSPLPSDAPAAATTTVYQPTPTQAPLPVPRQPEPDIAAGTLAIAPTTSTILAPSPATTAYRPIIPIEIPSIPPIDIQKLIDDALATSTTAPRATITTLPATTTTQVAPTTTQTTRPPTTTTIVAGR